MTGKRKEAGLTIGAKAVDAGPVRVVTDLKQEREAAKREHRRRDILERLRSRRMGDPAHVYEDIEDSAVEIEWLRAQRPDAVTRQELADVATELRTMKDAIDAILRRLTR